MTDYRIWAGEEVVDPPDIQADYAVFLNADQSALADGKDIQVVARIIGHMKNAKPGTAIVIVKESW